MGILASSDNRNVRKTVTNYSKLVEKLEEQSISVVRNWHKSYVLANVIQAGNACQFPSGVTVTAVARPFRSFLRGNSMGEKRKRKRKIEIDRERERRILAAVIVA